MITHQEISEIYKNEPKETLGAINQFLELYTTEQTFIKTMKDFDVEKLIRYGKSAVPEFFESNPQFETFLKQAFDFKEALHLPEEALKNGDLKAAGAALNEQMKSDAFKQNIVKMNLVCANTKLLNQFKLAINNNEGVENLPQYIESAFICPVQRTPRYGMFAKEFAKDNSDALGINDSATKRLISYASESNIATTKGNALNTIVLNINDEERFLDNLNQHRQENVYDIVNAEIDQLAKQQGGMAALIDKIKDLKNYYKQYCSSNKQGLKIDDSIYSLSAKIENCIAEVKVSNPDFKVDSSVKAIVKQAKDFDREMSIKLKDIKVINNSVQLDTVQKMQLNLLNDVINKLKKQLQKIEAKMAKNGGNERLSGKKDGLDSLLKSMQDIRSDVDNNQKLTYKQGEVTVGQRISSAIAEKKQENPLLTKGFFSSTAKALKQIEKRADLVQSKCVDRAVSDSNYAQRVNEKVNKRSEELKGPRFGA